MMLDDELAIILNPKKAKTNRTAGAEKARKSNVLKRKGGHGSANLKKIARMAAKHPEVMVKVSGGAKGLRHTREHMNYITRNGDVEAETEQGDILSNREQINDKAQRWNQNDIGRGKGRQTVNLVLSMPPGTNEEKLKKAVRNFALRTFAADREYLFVQHHDTKHPHCHLTLQAVGHDGKRLSPNKKQLQSWRESFAEALREQGVKAEATPRQSRGVVKKGEKQAVLHAAKRKESIRQQQRIKEAGERLKGGNIKRPWESRISEQQAAIRESWANIAKEIEKRPEGVKMASVIKDFIKGMPKPLTREQELVSKMASVIKQKEKEKEQGRGR